MEKNCAPLPSEVGSCSFKTPMKGDEIETSISKPLKNENKIEKMNLNESMNNLKNTDIFSGYLNFNINHNDIMDEDFPKPNFDSFDKYDYFDESSIKSLNSFNESLKSNLIKSTPEKINIEAKNEINMIKNDEETAKLKMNKYFKKEQSKKNFVNIIPNKESNEKEIKQKRLIMNRESAKKSRLKKKAYIENLEKQYLIMKKEYINIIMQIKRKLKSKLS